MTGTWKPCKEYMIDRPEEGREIKRLPVRLVRKMSTNEVMIVVPHKDEEAQLYLLCERK